MKKLVEIHDIQANDVEKIQVLTGSGKFVLPLNGGLKGFGIDPKLLSKSGI